MDVQNPNDVSHLGPVDADAVCVKCGTVNPEETLFCKSCGNNLRDQRIQRITRGDGIDLGDTRESKFRILTGVLITLGFVLIAGVLLFFENIEHWLVDIQTIEAGVGNADLWGGAGTNVYDEMLDDLQQFPSSPGQMRLALNDPVLDQSYHGRYAVAVADESGSLSIIGEASLRVRGGIVRFVFLHQDINFELRGYATLEGEADDRYAVVMNTASYRWGGSEKLIIGLAEPATDGSHACSGQGESEDSFVEAWAYRIP